MKYKFKSILFLGIGGISMHQLAISLKKLGIKVIGYDVKKNQYTKLCEENGIKVYSKFNKKICDVDICVKTSAIKNNTFTTYLENNKIPILDRAVLLGWLCSQFKNVIAVAGTHGKSTTAAVIYQILKANKEKVSCHIGAEIEDARFELGDDFLVVEACEFNKSFLKLKPTIAVVTNIEKEHMDCYKSLFDLKNSFLTFLKKAKHRFVYHEKTTKFLSKYKFINFVNRTDLTIEPQLKGDYNIKNLSLSIAVCRSLGVSDDVIKKVVNSFKGIPRRYEFVGTYNHSNIFLDYAHHPTEIKCFIKTFANNKANIQIIFQPHTFSRTKMFLLEFVSILAKVENLIIFKEFAARENKKDGIGAKELYLQIKKLNPNVKFCKTQSQLLKEIETNTNVAFVGAGNIDSIARKIVKN